MQIKGEGEELGLNNPEMRISQGYISNEELLDNFQNTFWIFGYGNRMQMFFVNKGSQIMTAIVLS